MVNRTAAAGCLALLLSACGGEPPPPAVAPKADAPEPDAGPVAKPKKTIDDHRAEFMASCGSKLPDATEYCACSWTETLQVFSPEDLDRQGDYRAKGAMLQDRVAKNCGRKLPEARIKASFLTGCAGDNPQKGPFCECTWTDLRKSLQPGDLADPEFAKTPGFGALATDSATVCGDKMPEDVVKEGFMKGCSSGRKDLEPFCACAWTAVRKEKSVADIGARRVDMATMRPRIEKACGRPPAK